MYHIINQIQLSGLFHHNMLLTYTTSETQQYLTHNGTINIIIADKHLSQTTTLLKNY